MYYIICDYCKGSGKDTDFDRKLVPCNQCKGRGFQLTKAGADFVDFFNKVIKPELEQKEKKNGK